jgi:hypothetical protein
VQTIYAAHLPLPAALGADALDRAVDAVAGWLHDRFKVSPAPLTGGSVRRDDVTVEWGSLFGDAGGLVGIEVDQPDPSDPTWRWRTHIDIGVEHGAAWLRARVALFSPIEGLVTRPKVAPHRPPVVRRVVDRLDVRIDNRRIGQPWLLTAADVPAYIAFLTNPQRRLPVLAISHDSEGEPFLDRARAADRLLGLAHVVEIDLQSSYAVTDAIGKTLSCYSGAVRVYWPGFAVGDDPYYHRAYVGGSLAYLGREGMGAELFDTLGRLSALSISEPDLRRRLRREQRARETAARAAEATAMRARLSTIEASVNGGIDHQTWESLAADYARSQARIDGLEEDLLDAQLEIEILREERDRAEAQARALNRALTYPPARAAAHAPAQLDVPEPKEEPTPQTVLEAVERAREYCTHLVFLPEAFTSAAESQYTDPERVLANLLLMEQIAADWSAGELLDGPHEAFQQRCSGYREAISASAAASYPQDYERAYLGRTVMLGPHIARGTGSAEAILRIYWFVDTENKRIVIGHVGRKLRDGWPGAAFGRGG